jgi:hypothetical protein
MRLFSGEAYRCAHKSDRGASDSHPASIVTRRPQGPAAETSRGDTAIVSPGGPVNLGEGKRIQAHRGPTVNGSYAQAHGFGMTDTLSPQALPAISKTFSRKSTSGPGDMGFHFDDHPHLSCWKIKRFRAATLDAGNRLDQDSQQEPSGISTGGRLPFSGLSTTMRCRRPSPTSRRGILR